MLGPELVALALTYPSCDGVAAIACLVESRSCARLKLLTLVIYLRCDLRSIIPRISLKSDVEE